MLERTRIGKGLILPVWFTRAGAARIREVTRQHIGDSLAVLIDSAVFSVPMIRQAIGGDPSLPSDIGVPLEPKEAQQPLLSPEPGLGLQHHLAERWGETPAAGAEISSGKETRVQAERRGQAVRRSRTSSGSAGETSR